MAATLLARANIAPARKLRHLRRPATGWAPPSLGLVTLEPAPTAPSDERPLGMFDSGFGGLTVARAVMDLLPDEHLVYVGDTGRYPYGPRPQEEVRGFAHQITRHLVEDEGVKLVVVACNTATAAAGLKELEDTAGVPVVGVIDPGARSLAAATRSGRVGVIGTVGTISSGAYQRAVAEAAVMAGRPVELTCAACPGFVEFVERGDTGSDQVHVLAERLLAPVRDAQVDTLLLGCTHYPFLARTIGDVMGRDVVLVSSADETAFEVRALLGGTDGVAPRRPGPGGAPARRRFGSSGDVDWFRELGARLLGPEVAVVERAPW
ncbi:MAG: glutamate racemase [Actinobacteria bacterium]|nr:glutamate racemase [Actinomycetota bacterium]